jgi:hypothetical protein
MVVHTYNPSYLGGRDQEEHGLRTSLGKNMQKNHANKPGMVVHICNHSYGKGIGRRIMV